MSANDKQSDESWKMFCTCMQDMAAIPAYRFQLAQPTLDVYWMVLRPYDAKVIRQAFDRAISEERSCPTPATIRMHARALQSEAKPSEPESFNWPTEEEAAEMRAQLQEKRREWAAKSREVNGDQS